MMTMFQSLSLTVGAVLGSFSSLFTKVKAIDAKHGRFELLLCTGDFFGPAGDEGELLLLLEGALDGEPIIWMCCVII